MTKLNPDVKILGVTAGLGVALYPFKDNLIGNIEPRPVFHTPLNEQWEANFPGIPLFKKDSWAPELTDVIISSPDCGSGSMLRMSRSKKMGDHKTNNSLITFLDYITQYAPKIFLFENLDGLFKSFPELEFRDILKQYRLIIHSCSVEYFGNSQKTRKRLIIVGIRNDLPKKVDKYFKKPDYRSKIKTCIKLYGDLKESNMNLGHVREHQSLIISIYARTKMSIRQIRLYWRQNLKGKKRWFTYGKAKFLTAPGVYRNLANDYPATARKANRQFDHKGRMLTPRQLARIMGVPDIFHIHMVEGKKKNYWINKGRTAITKGMVYEVATWFKKCLIKSQNIWIVQN